MKKKLLFFTLLSFAIASSVAQSIDQQVINSAGDHYVNNNQVMVSMGEVVIGHFKTNEGHISAGFIQPFTLEVELVNGLEDDLLAKVEVYPNPTTEYVNLKILSLGDVASEIEAVVYNETGIAVREFTLYTAGYVKKVDFSTLPSGIYILKLFNDTKTNTYRIIKK